MLVNEPVGLRPIQGIQAKLRANHAFVHGIDAFVHAIYVCVYFTPLYHVSE